MRSLKELKQMSKTKLVNRIYNDYLSDLTDDNENEIFESTYHKKIPYIGWLWRDIDVVNKDITIGDCGEFIGVMGNNKWGYPERHMSEGEVDKFIEYIDKVIDSIDSEDEILKELNNWMQTLKI